MKRYIISVLLIGALLLMQAGMAVMAAQSERGNSHQVTLEHSIEDDSRSIKITTPENLMVLRNLHNELMISKEYGLATNLYDLVPDSDSIYVIRFRFAEVFSRYGIDPNQISAAISCDMLYSDEKYLQTTVAGLANGLKVYKVTGNEINIDISFTLQQENLLEDAFSFQFPIRIPAGKNMQVRAE